MFQNICFDSKHRIHADKQDFLSINNTIYVKSLTCDYCWLDSQNVDPDRNYEFPKFYILYLLLFCNVTFDNQTRKKNNSNNLYSV